MIIFACNLSEATQSTYTLRMPTRRICALSLSHGWLYRHRSWIVHASKVMSPRKKVSLSMKQMTTKLDPESWHKIVAMAGSGDLAEASTHFRSSDPNHDRNALCHSLTNERTKCKSTGNIFPFNTGGSLNCDSYCAEPLTNQLSTLIDEIAKCAQHVQAIYVSARFVWRQRKERKVVGSMLFNRIDGWKFEIPTEQPDRERFTAKVSKQGFNRIELSMIVPEHKCHIESRGDPRLGFFTWESADRSNKNLFRLTLKCTAPGPGPPSRFHDNIVEQYGVAREAYQKMVGIIAYDGKGMLSKTRFATRGELTSIMQAISRRD